MFTSERTSVEVWEEMGDREPFLSRVRRFEESMLSVPFLSCLIVRAWLRSLAASGAFSLYCKGRKDLRQEDRSGNGEPHDSIKIL